MNIEAIIHAIAEDTRKTPEYVRKTEVGALADLFGYNTEEIPFPYLTKLMEYVQNALNDWIWLEAEYDNPAEQGDVTMLSTVDYYLGFDRVVDHTRTGGTEEEMQHTIRRELLTADETDVIWCGNKMVENVGAMMDRIQQVYDEFYADIKRRGYIDDLAHVQK